jgi:hypothetical protein
MADIVTGPGANNAFVQVMPDVLDLVRITPINNGQTGSLRYEATDNSRH